MNSREERDKIRTFLLTNNLTQAWLIDRLSRLGVEVDKSSMSSILAGTRKGTKSCLVVESSAKVINDYNAKMNKKR